MTSEDQAENTSQTVTAVEWMCPNCGDEVDVGEECEAWDCSYCGETMVPKDRSDVTPNDRLREIIEKWRGEAADYPAAVDPRAEAAQAAVELCAEELEELVEE